MKQQESVQDIARSKLRAPLLSIPEQRPLTTPIDNRKPAAKRGTTPPRRSTRTNPDKPVKDKTPPSLYEAIPASSHSYLGFNPHKCQDEEVKCLKGYVESLQFQRDDMRRHQQAQEIFFEFIQKLCANDDLEEFRPSDNCPINTTAPLQIVCLLSYMGKM